MNNDYEEIELYNEKVKIKNYYCSSNPNIFEKGNMKLNLYIKITDSCNANCKFCSNSNTKDSGNINLDKLKDVLIYLNSKDILNRISITGGEPLLKMDLLNDVLNLVFEIIPNSKVTINTNGYNIKKVLDLDSINKLYGIHISRHHYSDEVNNKIFGIEVASTDDIKYVMDKVNNKQLLRLNCLFIKDYIDDMNSIYEYLEFASKLNIFRVGFVSLMKINDYSKENFIDFNNIILKESNKNKNVSHYFDKNICECINGVYIANNGNFIEYYARMTKELNCEYSRQLVYTSDNKLTTGFNKKSLI